jgi:hypothetical protein
MNQLFRVWARFEPDHVNPLTGRKGQWRVVQSRPIIEGVAKVWRVGSLRILLVPSTKPYPRGSIIRPHKELNRVLAMRGAA